MRLFASVVGWLHAAALALLVIWPRMSDQPFPLSALKNVMRGEALTVLAIAAVAFALWASLFWRHARQHQIPFALLATACFLYAALFVSVPAGIGFAALAMLVRSR